MQGVKWRNPVCKACRWRGRGPKIFAFCVFSTSEMEGGQAGVFWRFDGPHTYLVEAGSVNQTGHVNPGRPAGAVLGFGITLVGTVYRVHKLLHPG